MGKKTSLARHSRRLGINSHGCKSPHHYCPIYSYCGTRHLPRPFLLPLRVDLLPRLRTGTRYETSLDLQMLISQRSPAKALNQGTSTLEASQQSVVSRPPTYLVSSSGSPGTVLTVFVWRPDRCHWWLQTSLVPSLTFSGLSVDGTPTADMPTKYWPLFPSWQMNIHGWTI